MKSVLRNAVAGVAIASLGFASAASAATGTADVDAQILDALSVDANGTTLDFGTIAESGSGGTLQLETDGNPICSAGLVCGGTTSVPTFTITGEDDADVTVSFPAATVTLTRVGFTETMTVGSLVASDTAITLDNTGVGTFTVGATLAVSANQAVGFYEGELDVEVVYD
jgi:hypothetical protein